MIKTRLILLPDDADAPAPTVTFDEAGRLVARAALRPDEPNLPDMAHDVVVVPGVETASHWLALPMRGLRQARGAAAVLLEDSLATPVEGMHLALGDVEADGSRLVVAVSDALMRGWLEQAARLGVRPDVVTPAYALLPEPEDASLIVAAVLPSELAVRGQGFAAAVEPELLEAVAGGRRIRPVEDAAERDLILARGAAAPAVNLLQGAYDPAANQSAGAGDFRLVAALAAVLVVSPLVLWGAQIARDRGAAASLDRKSEALAERFAPGTLASAPPVERLNSRLRQLEGGEAFVRSVAVLFGVVEQTPGAQIANLFYGGYGQVRATIAHANYSDADAMKAQAARFGYALTEDAASTENGRVMTDVVLEAKR